MQPWYIAAKPFTSRHEAWAKYIEWSGLTQLDEVVSLDQMLCPSVLPDIKPEYWPHIVNEDFMLQFFVDLESSRSALECCVSALTNCGGFPEVFENSELSSKRLLTSCSRALEIQLELRRKHPEEPHANCHVWAIFRAVAP